jgi:secondary thiamine-phosphate synthase enzyme
MSVITRTISLKTAGNGDVADITASVRGCVSESDVVSGLVTVFTPSATSGISTLEFEPGCVSDLQRLFDEIIPVEKEYAHNQRWGDGNGHSHARAALTKPSLTVPIVNGELTLGTWQSIILVDFDNRPRNRELVVQIMGE